MAYATALQAPNRQQWEPSSAYSQSWNCGPTSATFIAGFYRDTRYGIEATRRSIAGMGPYQVTGTGLVYGAPAKTPTSAWQQRDMLLRRGVRATVRQLDSVSQLHGLVDSGRRPCIVGIQMSRVPSSVRGHSFLGWHAVVVIAGGSSGGVRGFWVMDPNFASGSPSSRRFYSDAVMQNAWASNSPRWCVVPDAAKPAPVTAAYVKFNAGVNGVNLRSGPTSLVDNIYATAWSDADPKPNGIIRRSDGKWIGNTGARRTLYATVRGNDGHVYYRIRMAGTNANQYVNTRFMSRV